MVRIFREFITSNQIAEILQLWPQNQPLPRVVELVSEILEFACAAHPLFHAAVQPRRISTAHLWARGTGMANEPLPNQSLGATLSRADVFFTVVLNPPDDYNCPGLLIDTGYGEEAYKEDAGTAIAYPASAKVRFGVITRGLCRGFDVAVQSSVRSAGARQILYDIASAERYVEIFAKAQVEELALLKKTREALQRLWWDV